MTTEEKLSVIKALLDDGGTLPSDEKLNAYLMLAKNEVLQWKYHLVGGVPDTITDVPLKDENAQIYAVIAGYTQAGAEGESTHNENGVQRVFRQSDMIDYIRRNVLAYVGVGVVKS